MRMSMALDTNENADEQNSENESTQIDWDSLEVKEDGEVVDYII